jgi:hypothetical protein
MNLNPSGPYSLGDDAEERATRRQTSVQKSRNASTLAGGNRREGRIANNGNVSPGQSGKRSTTVPLATKGLTLSARTCAIPAPATQAAIIVSTSASVNRPAVSIGKNFLSRRNSHSKGLPRCGSMYWMQSWAAWLLAQESFVVPIPGTRSVDHLDENLRAQSMFS